MSNTADRVLNAGTKLKSYSVKIGNINLIKETISSLELSFRNDTPVILGRLIIDDLYDMNSQIIWKDISVNVFYMDVFDKLFSNDFYVIGISETYDEQYKKKFVLDLQDKFSYTLQNSYLSKSFKSDIITALKAYITELKLSSYKTDFDDIKTVQEFVIPKNIDNLSFFIMELTKCGYVFYQTKEKIVIKHISNIEPKKLIENDPGKPFKNETSNQLYKNRISGIRTFFLKRKSIPPITKSIAYNPEKKVMGLSSDNDNSVYYLSDDPLNLQKISTGGGYNGTKEIYQVHLNFDEHKLHLREAFMRQSEIEIIVNGYIKNDVNQIYELDLKGNSSGSEQQAKGNTVINGKYISNTVMDKLVGDSLIQKIHLYRADLTKKI